jgi:hypothetical protein
MTPLTPLTPDKKKVVSKTIGTSNTGFEANNDAAFQSKKDGGVTVSRVSGGVKKDQQTALKNQLGCIWHDKNISNIQATVNALDQLSLEDGAILHDIVEYVSKISENGSKQALLNFVVARLGLIDDGDDDEWWNALN